VEIKAILSDGSAAVFADLSPAEFMAKRKENTLESSIYKNIFEELSNKETQNEITEFPNQKFRRNTGYGRIVEI
jgi:hypothetical protein